MISGRRVAGITVKPRRVVTGFAGEVVIARRPATEPSCPGAAGFTSSSELARQLLARDFGLTRQMS